MSTSKSGPSERLRFAARRPSRPGPKRSHSTRLSVQLFAPHVRFICSCIVSLTFIHTALQSTGAHQVASRDRLQST
eukprot:2523335-Amphidinium_carterae.4